MSKQDYVNSQLYRHPALDGAHMARRCWSVFLKHKSLSARRLRMAFIIDFGLHKQPTEEV